MSLRKAAPRALEATVAEDAQRHARSLEGVSANMGAEDLRRSAHELGNAARSGKFTEAGKLLLTIRDHFDELREVLERDAEQ